MGHRGDHLGRGFIRTGKRRWGAFCMADAATPPLTFGRALVGSLLLARWLRKQAPAEPRIGLLLPSSVGGALANIAVALAGKTSVNLNFTTGREGMAAAIARCQLRTILTSRKFLAKADLAAPDGAVFLEDVLTQFTSFQKARMLVLARLLPASLLLRHSAGPGNPDSIATIVFSSGSTGVPKGVMLTHGNILANIDAVRQVFHLKNDDVMVGVLPFFHSFGFTVTLWLPMVSGFGAVFHPNPMDGKTIGELAEKYHGSILVSTPTFYAGYVRKCRREQFAWVRYALVGAEKLRDAIAEAFEDKFGITLLEGYGCTEMAPVVAVNAPGGARGSRRGTVGQPLPGVTAKVVDPESGEGPLVGREGLLLVNGPSRMQGYLGEPERTAEVLRDGWYATGDIACIDEAGFIRITDRLSRFSKIGGEMVPHMKIEEHIQGLMDPQHTCAVTAIPDDARGERLVVFYTDPDLAAAALWERLCRSELPRLWLPKREDIRFIQSIPVARHGQDELARRPAAGRRGGGTGGLRWDPSSVSSWWFWCSSSVCRCSSSACCSRACDSCGARSRDSKTGCICSKSGAARTVRLKSEATGNQSRSQSRNPSRNRRVASRNRLVASRSRLLASSVSWKIRPQQPPRLQRNRWRTASVDGGC